MNPNDPNNPYGPNNPRVRILPGMTFNPTDFDLRGLIRTTPPGHLDDGFRRASSDSECPMCRHRAGDHPMCGMLLDHENNPFLNVLCGGERVKL
jgi:hypothetical protein